MKTAIVIAGEARTFKDCFSSLNSCILSQNTCDFFIHLYEDQHTEEVLNLYSPKKFLIEKKDTINFPVPEICEKNRYPEVNAFSCMCQWRNVQKAFELIDGNYDCVMKTRYDIKYTNPLKLDSFDMQKLNVPLGGDWRGGLFDQFAFGSYELMANYCSMFSNIETYCKLGVPCHPETLNRFNNRNLPVNRFEYTIILRRRYEHPFIEDRVSNCIWYKD